MIYGTWRCDTKKQRIQMTPFFGRCLPKWELRETSGSKAFRC